MSHEAFMDAIIRNPEDDSIRLIYADWLGENGKPEREEFIRVQVELENAPLEPHNRNMEYMEWEKLRRRERELLEEPLALRESKEPEAWKVTLCKAGNKWIWRRGFICEVHCTCADWLAHGPAIVKSQPVERCVLLDKRPCKTGDGYFFSRETYTETYAWCLDHDLYCVLCGKPKGTSALHLPSRMSYQTEQAAMDALSEACLKLAKG